MLKLRHAIVAACLGAALPVLAADNAALSVADPYVRLVPPGTATTGAFMVIKNAGKEDRKLVKAESTAAKTVELHNHVNDGGVMKMRPVKEVEVKAGGEAALKPGSYHVMLIDLKAPLKEGDKVAITLGFDDGSSKTVEAPVRKPQAEMKMEHQHGHEMHH